MKTTIDIPEALYKRAKIHAIETGRTLKDIVLGSLEKELAATPTETPTWANRKLLPEFQHLMESGALSGGTDSTILLSEERSSREEALGS